MLAESAPRVPGRLAAGLSGALAGALALSTGEVVAAFGGAQVSPVTAVGNQLIDWMAGSLKEFAVAVFGTRDKDALLVGIVVVALAIAVGLGIASRRWAWACPVGVAAFAVVGTVCTATDPLGGVGSAISAAVVATAIGTAAFVSLWRAATPGATPEGPTGPARIAGIDRRRFLAAGGATLVLSAAGALSIGRLRAGQSVESARRSTVLPRPTRVVGVPIEQPFAPAGLSPYVTSNRDFFRIDTALGVPQVDVAGWRLRVDGLVDRPFELTYDELLALDSVELPVTIQCVSNGVGGNLVGNAVWQGVPLATLLERAGVQASAEQVFSRSVDGFTAGFPLGDGLDGRSALVAFAMNGEPLPAAHGYPARLVVAGLYGYVSATKWLARIELATWDDADGYWIPRGWAKEGPIKTMSRIDVPRPAEPVDAGPQPIAGVAWAPGVGIERVEVQIDDGEWHACRLGRSASDDTWVQWLYEWDATPGGHLLRVRATDKTGHTQTSEEAPPAPDGATGWHERWLQVT